MNLENKKITVVGLGKSGFASAKFLHEQKARVFVTDASEKKETLENASYLRSLGIQVETGKHTDEFVAGSAAVVKSPGVPSQAPPLVYAKKKKIPVISEVELAWRFCKGKIVAVTGSNGKTTTCNLIHRILKDAGKDAVLCGNVGYSFMDTLPSIKSSTVVVLELSSFQLEDSPTIKPAVAVILNLHANHLDRHQTFENYAAAKAHIFKNQTSRDLLVLNADDERVRRYGASAKSTVWMYSKHGLEEGISLSATQVSWRAKKGSKALFDVRQCKLQGAHNQENMMAAAAVALRLRVPLKSLRKTLASFSTLEHRIEPLGEIAGIRFFNDSKSTTVESTRRALETVPGPLVLVAGGRDKGLQFSELEGALHQRVRSVVLYGEAREKIAAAWSTYTHVKTERDFVSALRLAYEEARPGDAILLSPMGTSFDQFTSFEERGETFRHFVEDLRKTGINPA